MICKPIRYRSMDDDYAPVDYSYVRSVSEGAKLRQAQNLPRMQGDGTVVRHNPDPNDRGRSDGYGTRARRSNVVMPQDAKHTIPSLEQGPPPVTRVAYPDPAPEENQEISAVVSENVDEPMQQPGFDPPAKVEMPDWLRVAQQNHLPSQEQRARAPRVQAAPRQPAEEPATDMLGRPLRRAAHTSEPEMPQSVREYSAAGYPQELVEEQMRREQQWAEQSGHKRHGAQRVVRAEEQEWEEPRRNIRATQERTASYPPPRQEMTGANRRAAEPRGMDWQEPPRARAGYERTRAYASGEAETYPRDVEYESSQPGYARRERYAATNEGREAERFGRAGYSAQPGAWQGDAAVQPARGYEEDGSAQEETQRPWQRKIPWLGIGVAAALFVCIGLWLLQVTFDRTMQGVLTVRAEAEQAVANSHPYQYRELIETQAQRNNLHPAFIAAIVLNESSFRPQAESSVGARGLMQMMPDTAEWVHEKMDEDATFSFDDMYDPQKNVRYACWYMKFLSDRFSGDPVLVSAAFHSGQGNVQNWLNNSKYSADGRTIDLEDMMDGPTKKYASRVLRDYAVYKRLYYEQQGV